MYLDGLDVEQLDANDFIFSATDAMQADAPVVYDDVAQLMTIMPDFTGSNPELASVYPQLKMPQFLVHTLTASSYAS